MDEKIIFYIVLGIVYFIFNALRKKKPEDEPGADQPRPGKGANRPQPVSFEDLLREITEGKVHQEKNQPPVTRQHDTQRLPVPSARPVSTYNTTSEEEENSLEQVIFDDDRSNRAYEEAKKMAFYRPSLEETMKLDDVDVTYSRFKEFEKKKPDNQLQSYIKELKDPKGFKKALILSEVLNRKYA